jgi:hypothetical protein
LSAGAVAYLHGEAIVAELELALAADARGEGSGSAKPRETTHACTFTDEDDLWIPLPTSQASNLDDQPVHENHAVSALLDPTGGLSNELPEGTTSALIV